MCNGYLQKGIQTKQRLFNDLRVLSLKPNEAKPNWITRSPVDALTSSSICWSHKIFQNTICNTMKQIIHHFHHIGKKLHEFKTEN